MKKHLFFIFLLLAMALTKNTIAQTAVYIPDPNFRNFLNVNYPAVMNVSGDSLIIASAATINGTLDCNHQGISDLSGVEYFSNITGLSCYNNQLTSLPDLSTITGLVILWCNNNQLTNLPDLSANTALANLDCSNNQLTTLPDLSANTALGYIWCNNNQLISIPDLSIFTGLLVLNCSDNQLTQLSDISANTALRQFYCSNNLIADLPDPSSDTELIHFYCDNNKLDFSDARELRIVDVLPNLTSFEYSPQKPFGNADTVYVSTGGLLVLNIVPQDSALGYQWFKNGTSISGAIDVSLTVPQVSATDTGIYTCKSYGTALESPPMTHGSGISEFESASIVVKINNTDNIQEREFDNKIKIFPNPATKKVTVESQSVIESFSLYDISGKKIMEFSPHSDRFNINVSDLTAGTYIVKVNDFIQKISIK
jgi:hypothetical protein